MFGLIAMAIAAIIAEITTTSLKAAAAMKLAKAELYSSEKELERAKIEAELKIKLAEIEKKKGLVGAATVRRQADTQLSKRQQQQKLIIIALLLLLTTGAALAIFKSNKNGKQ